MLNDKKYRLSFTAEAEKLVEQMSLRERSFFWRDTVNGIRVWVSEVIILFLTGPAVMTDSVFLRCCSVTAPEVVSAEIPPVSPLPWQEVQHLTLSLKKG